MGKGLYEMFQMFDRNGDGMVDRNELEFVLSTLDARWTEERLDKLFKVVDTEGKGSIDYSEFMVWAYGQMQGPVNVDPAEEEAPIEEVSEFRTTVIAASEDPDVEDKLSAVEAAEEAATSAAGPTAAEDPAPEAIAGEVLVEEAAPPAIAGEGLVEEAAPPAPPAPPAFAEAAAYEGAPVEEVAAKSVPACAEALDVPVAEATQVYDVAPPVEETPAAQEEAVEELGDASAEGRVPAAISAQAQEEAIEELGDASAEGRVPVAVSTQMQEEAVEELRDASAEGRVPAAVSSQMQEEAVEELGDASAEGRVPVAVSTQMQEEAVEELGDASAEGRVPDAMTAAAGFISVEATVYCSAPEPVQQAPELQANFASPPPVVGEVPAMEEEIVEKSVPPAADDAVACEEAAQAPAEPVAAAGTERLLVLESHWGGGIKLSGTPGHHGYGVRASLGMATEALHVVEQDGHLIITSDVGPYQGAYHDATFDPSWAFSVFGSQYEEGAAIVGYPNAVGQEDLNMRFDSDGTITIDAAPQFVWGISNEGYVVLVNRGSEHQLVFSLTA